MTHNAAPTAASTLKGSLMPWCMALLCVVTAGAAEQCTADVEPATVEILTPGHIHPACIDSKGYGCCYGGVSGSDILPCDDVLRQNLKVVKFPGQVIRVEIPACTPGVCGDTCPCDDHVFPTAIVGAK